jgi:leucyl/phenylalanyl-tRNA--protein transferase
MFPMVVELPQPAVGWWSPVHRGVLPLEALRVTRSMRQSSRRYEVRIDTCFVDVISRCADPRRPKGWITDEFIEAYSRLHDLGWAHSVEVFDREGQLAGGLYGVRVNGLFAGESMFYLQRDASKVALMSLVDLMRDASMTLLDVQWCTGHLASLGAVEIDRQAYLMRLARALEQSEPDVLGAPSSLLPNLD